MQAERLKGLRAKLGGEGLLLDAGDAISAGNVTYHPGGEAILTLMSEIGYDAMTVGNREFHLTQSGFHAKVANATFPVLCANVRSRGESAAPVVPYIMRTLTSGLRVTVFGLTVPMITERMLVRKLSAYVFDDPIKVAADLTAGLRSSCDLLVCLSHIGIAKDRELAAAVHGIDLIIGGHTHVTLDEGERVGGALIVQAGWWGHSLGRVIVNEARGALHLSATIESL